MAYISKNNTINISVKFDIVENIIIGSNCSFDEIQSYSPLFKEFCDVFARSCEEIPNIDHWIVDHKITYYAHVC